MNSKESGSSASCPSLCSSDSVKGKSAIVAHILIQEVPVDPANPDIPPVGEGWQKGLAGGCRKPDSSLEQLAAAIRLLATDRPDVLAMLAPVAPMVWSRSITEEERQLIIKEHSHL